jgi:hypothetical protein
MKGMELLTELQAHLAAWKEAGAPESELFDLIDWARELVRLPEIDPAIFGAIERTFTRETGVAPGALKLKPLNIARVNG